MVVEAWHRERPGESFNPMAQISDASHSLWVLNEEVFEFLELSWRRKTQDNVAQSLPFQTNVFIPISGISCQLTGLLLDIQPDLEALIHELNNLYEICFFELPGSESRSTCDAKHSGF